MSYPLNTTTRKIEFLLSGAAATTNPTSVVAFEDFNPSGEPVPTFPQLASANGVTAVSICDAPPQDYVRRVVGITIANVDTASVTLTVRYNDNGTYYQLNKSTLLTGETLGYTAQLGWYALDVNGNLKQVTASTFAGLTSSGAVSITDTTQSTSTTTGALKVSGGVGVAKNLYVGGLVATAASASGGAGLLVPHGSAPSSPNNGDVWTTTSGLFARINGSTVGPYVATGGVFTSSFTSSDQTITAAGTLTLAHSLGGMPALVQCRLKNSSTEGGYSADDELMLGFNSGIATGNNGMAVVPDATNINVYFGSSVPFIITNKSTGAAFSTDPTKWVLIVKAWR